MSYVCTKQDCTIAATGICLLGRVAAQCEFSSQAEHASHEPDVDTTGASAEPPVSTRRAEVHEFHAGIELGTMEAAKIMMGRYARLIGILGLANAGKTCLLSSLYLMAYQGLLQESYQFAGSLTLQGFEDRVWGARKWEHGNFPEQLSAHTHIADFRSPALLHIALSREGVKQDILFTDLPGEWSKSLVDRAETASRFDFLQRADGIVVVIDGPLLESAETRHSEFQRAKLLISRLAWDVRIDSRTPIVIALSKCDLLGMCVPAHAGRLRQEARELGFTTVDIVPTAAFSSRPDTIQSGTGVVDIVHRILTHSEQNLLSQMRSSGTRYSSSRAFSRLGDWQV